MKKVFIAIISALIVFVGGFLLYIKVVKPMILKPPAALTVNCQGCRAVVFLDGKKLGNTPLKLDKVSSGESKLMLSDGRYSFEKEIILTPRTKTVVNQDLGPSEVFSAGEIIWLERSDLGETVSILSNPIESEVKLDGNLIGKTPLTTESLETKEHTFEISKKGYEGRITRISVVKGYKINISFQLYPLPVPESPVQVAYEAGEVLIYKVLDFSTLSPILFSDPASWAKGAAHYLVTRPSKPKVHYFIDFNGQIYDQGGALFLPTQEVELKDKTLAYLGKTDDKGLTEGAKLALESFSSGKGYKPGEEVEKAEKMVEVLETGTGWLRVRSESSLSGEEIGRVNVGEKYEVLGEETGWYQIELKDGLKGWISGQYAKIVTEETEGESEEKSAEE